MAKPITVVICDTCEQPWEAHLRMAQHQCIEDAWDYDEELPVLTSKELAERVTPEDCIALLRIANRGPVGPTGATGPQGMAGRNADG